jgi:single-stranded-DNA-specific exonuclease
MLKKIIRREAVESSALSNELPAILRRIYAARGIREEADLDYRLARLLPATGLLGIDDAIERLLAAHQLGERVLIVGDFDADGATSCAVAVRALRLLGFQHVDFLVPDRFNYGYGLTPELVQAAAERSPELIVTVDNGIAANPGVAAANALGIDVLVTDHHLPGDELPEAVAIVNPNQPGCEFASKSLAGVGVIFYVMLALRRALQEEGWFESQGKELPNLAQLLDIVALGTVADVVPLDRNNRILVEQGLRRIRAGSACAGILALLEVGGRDAGRITATDLGFVLGPRLNAAGRMEDMSVGIRCLLADDKAEAQQLAAQLDSLNRERRSVEGQMQVSAEQMLSAVTVGDNSQTSICLFDPSWHQGVIGILASRVKDRYHRPVIVFAKGDDGQIKGSARSIPGLHIRDVLDEISKLAPELISKFGGHAMAAGLTIAEDDFEMFADALEAVVSGHVSEEILQAQLVSDGELAREDFSLNLAHQLRFAGPWGQANPEPLFDGQFKLINQRIVGEKHLKMVLAPAMAPDMAIDAIAFNVDTDSWPNNNAHDVSLVYRLDVNSFRGQETVQLIVEQIEA